MKRSTGISNYSENFLMKNGYFKCFQCNTYAPDSEMRMHFNLDSEGNFQIPENDIFTQNSVKITCSTCYDELNNKN